MSGLFQKSSIPHLFTTGNFAAGFIGCVLVVHGEYNLAVLMMMVGILCDCVDGNLARRFGTEGEFGGQLDSLADCVTFGVMPALLIGAVCSEALGIWSWVAATAFACAGALRLARFNAGNDAASKKHSDFEGLPTTGAASAVFGMYLLHLWWGSGHPESAALLKLMPAAMVLLAALMVSRIPYSELGGRLLGRDSKINKLIAVPLLGVALILQFHITMAFFTWLFVASGPGRAIGSRVRSHMFHRD